MRGCQSSHAVVWRLQHKQSLVVSRRRVPLAARASWSTPPRPRRGGPLSPRCVRRPSGAAAAMRVAALSVPQAPRVVVAAVLAALLSACSSRSRVGVPSSCTPAVTGWIGHHIRGENARDWTGWAKVAAAEVQVRRPDTPMQTESHPAGTTTVTLCSWRSLSNASWSQASATIFDRRGTLGGSAPNRTISSGSPPRRFMRTSKVDDSALFGFKGRQ